MEPKFSYSQRFTALKAKMCNKTSEKIKKRFISRISKIIRKYNKLLHV